jgi:hypothetical protein
MHGVKTRLYAECSSTAHHMAFVQSRTGWACGGWAWWCLHWVYPQSWELTECHTVRDAQHPAHSSDLSMDHWRKPSDLHHTMIYRRLWYSDFGSSPRNCLHNRHAILCIKGIPVKIPEDFFMTVLVSSSVSIPDQFSLVCVSYITFFNLKIGEKHTK